MKLLVALCLVAIVAAAPPARHSYATDNAKISKYVNNNFGSGNYIFAFEQSDGTRVRQRGRFKNEGREDERLAVTGSFSYVSPDGVRYNVRYTAGVGGYKAEQQTGENPKFQSDYDDEEPPGAVPYCVLASCVG